MCVTENRSCGPKSELILGFVRLSSAFVLCYSHASCVAVSSYFSPHLGVLAWGTPSCFWALIFFPPLIPVLVFAATPQGVRGKQRRNLNVSNASTQLAPSRCKSTEGRGGIFTLFKPSSSPATFFVARVPKGKTMRLNIKFYEHVVL